MARFDTSGLDDVIREMEQLGELYGETADEMLMAGAEEVKKAWKESAERHKHRDTGDMIKSIGYSRQPKRVGDIRSIDIYPQGTDQKAFATRKRRLYSTTARGRARRRTGCFTQTRCARNRSPRPWRLFGTKNYRQ